MKNFKTALVLILLSAFSLNCTSVQSAVTGTAAGGGILLGSIAVSGVNLTFGDPPDPNVSIAASIAAITGLAIFVTSVASYTSLDDRAGYVNRVIQRTEQTRREALSRTATWQETSSPSRPIDSAEGVVPVAPVFNGAVWNFASTLIEGSFVQRNTRDIAIRCDSGSTAECRYFVQMVMHGLDNFDLEDGELCEFATTACEETADIQICAETCD